MEFRQTKHQVARGAFPDAQTQDRIYAIKNLATLRATYQVRLLTYLASESGKRLIIRVPPHFKPHPTLKRILDEFPKAVQIETVK